MGNNEQNSNYWGSMSNSATRDNVSFHQSHTTTPANDFNQPHQQEPAQQWQSNQVGGYQQPYQQYQQPYQYNQPRVYSSGKDHIAAGLLAIFLGGLGIHKFYLGYNSAGFIMLGVTILGSLFTLGLAGLVMEVIGIVEGILYLTKDQQSFDRIYVYNMKEWF